jgi:hypothetical protein
MRLLTMAVLLSLVGCGGGKTGTAATCPSSMIPCGPGCMPKDAVCCDPVNGNSYCASAAGGGCIAQTGCSDTSEPSRFCCSTNSSIGSYDCPTGLACGIACEAAGSSCCAGANCGTLGTPGSPSSGGTPDLGSGASRTITLTANGVAFDLSVDASAIKASAPYLTDIQGDDASDSPQHTVTLQLGVYPPVIGTYNCGTELPDGTAPPGTYGVDLSYYGSGAAWSAGVNGAALQGSTPTSCTISVTSYTAGGTFEGTFSGSLAQNDAPNVAPIAITNGHFKLTAP